MTVTLLTAEQLAERWQVPTSQVYRLSREGAIPTVKIGRYCRYRVDLIETWERSLDSESVHPTVHRVGGMHP